MSRSTAVHGMPLGAAGELVTSPAELGLALRRAFDARVPYLVNVATDPEVAYPAQPPGSRNSGPGPVVTHVTARR
jgi:thiamine pyrophosphate-dependent acetolactate synthase large subunit-like protein